MATNNSVNSPLSGTTGTGSFVGSTSATMVTPTLGAATATSVAFSPTTGGIIGTTAANNASAGTVGEVISSVIAVGSSVSLSSGSAHDLTSISLTAGDWDVFGNVSFTIGGSCSIIVGWTSTSSATLPAVGLYNGIGGPGLVASGIGLAVPYARYNFSSTTPVFISAFSNFTTSTVTVCGQIYARRVR